MDRGLKIFIACMVVLAVLIALGFIFSVKADAKAPDFTIYGTAIRDGYTGYATTDGTLCTVFTGGSNNTGTFLFVGHEDMYDDELLTDYYYDYSAFASFPLTTVTGTVDSVRVFLPILSRSVACTGDPYINIYVGDCQIGTDCTTALSVADSVRVTTLSRTWKVSQFPTSGNVSWKIVNVVGLDSIVVGAGHTLDIRLAEAVNGIPNVCNCTNSSKNLIGLSSADISTKPYILVYTTAAASSAPTHCVFSNSRLQGQVNNSTPKRLRMGTPGRGVGKTASGS